MDTDLIQQFFPDSEDSEDSSKTPETNNVRRDDTLDQKKELSDLDKTPKKRFKRRKKLNKEDTTTVSVSDTMPSQVVQNTIPSAPIVEGRALLDTVVESIDKENDNLTEMTCNALGKSSPACAMATITEPVVDTYRPRYHAMGSVIRLMLVLAAVMFTGNGVLNHAYDVVVSNPFTTFGIAIAGMGSMYMIASDNDVKQEGSLLQTVYVAMSASMK